MNRPSLAGLRTKAGGSSRSGPLHIACLALTGLVVIAAVLAVWFSVDWYRAEHDDDIELAQVREEVLRDAQQSALNLVSFDHTRAAEGIALALQSSTGDLRKEFEDNRQMYVDTITAGKRTTEGKPVTGAVTELDDRSGTARAIIAVDVTVHVEGAPADQPDPVVRQRMQVEMSRTDDGWKASAIAPVGEAGQSVVPN